MPGRGEVTRKRRVGLWIYSLALEANEPTTTQDQVHGWVEDRAAHWKKEYGWQVPTTSRGKQYIHEILEGRAWLDDPWHLGIFATHRAEELELASLPYVMAVALRVFAGGKRLTARQARWVARLRPLLPPATNPIGDGYIQHLYWLVVNYSARERAADAVATATGLDEPFIPQNHESNTWPLDMMLSAYRPLGTPLGGPAMWRAYTEARDAGLIEAPDWLEWDASLGSVTTSSGVAPLYQLMRDAEIGGPVVEVDWRWTTTALLRLRARATGSDWDAFSRDEQLAAARGIAKSVVEEPGQ